MIPFLLAVAMALTDPSPWTRVHSAPGTLTLRSLSPLLPALPLLAGVATVVILMTDRVSVALAGLLMAATAVMLLNSQIVRRRQRTETESVSQFLGDLVADLEAGADPATALSRAAQEIPAQAGEVHRVLQAAATAARQGRSPALVLTEHTSSSPVNAVGKAWSVADEYGIGLAAVLASHRTQLTAQLRHYSATTATLQGPQATALILALLPLAGLGLGSSMGANPLGWLLGGGLGGVMLLAGTGLNCAGLLLSQRIIEGARS